MKIKAIAAIGEDNAIGKDNTLLWHLPNDLKFLEKNIENCWVLSGRKSYESTQGTELFDNRENIIVLTRQSDYKIDKGLVAHSIEEVLAMAQDQGMQSLCVLGGAAIYEAMLNHTDQLIITRVHATFPEADTFFPKIDPEKWRITSEEFHKKDELHDYDYSFVIYDRIGAK